MTEDEPPSPVADVTGDRAPPAPALRPPSIRGDTATLLTGKILSNLTQAALAIATARGLGPSGRGSVVLVVTVVTVTTLFSSAGTSVVMRTRLATTDRGDDGLSAFLGLGCVLIALQAALTAVVASVALLLPDVHLQPVDIVVIAVLGAASVAVWLLLDVLHGLGHHRSVAKIDVTGSLAQLGCYVVATRVLAPSVRLVLLAVLAGYLLEVVMLLSALGSSSRPAINRSEWRSVLRDGVSPLSQSLAELAVFRADRLVLGFSRSTREVGLYSLAAATAELLRLLPLALGQVLSRRVAANTVSAQALQRIRFVVLGTMATAALGVAAVGSWLIPELAGDAFRSAVPILAVMVLAETILGSYLLDTHVAQAQGRYRSASVPARVCGPVILALNLAVIPAYGVSGAAWSTVAGYTGMAVMARVIVRRTRPEPTVAADDRA